ncbi:hypothetical protein ACA910_000386 [Epithemia clementina (nom. ined.)]
MQDLESHSEDDPYLNQSEHSSSSNHGGSNHSFGNHPSDNSTSSTSTDFFSKQPPVCQSLVCVICHDVFKRASSLRCGHTFCFSCIREYFSQRERSCPICRRQYSTTFSLSPNLVAQQVISELEEFYRQSKEEKHEMETLRQFLLSSNQTLQTSLDMQETSLEESRRLFNTLELQSSQELSKVEAELQHALDEKRELEESNQVLRATVQQLQAAQEESQTTCEVLEFTLREEIQTRYNQMADSQQEKDCLRQQVKLLGDELVKLRNLSRSIDAPGALATSSGETLFLRSSLQNTRLSSDSFFDQLHKIKHNRNRLPFGRYEQEPLPLERMLVATRLQPHQPSLESQWKQLPQLVMKWVWTVVVLAFQILSEFPVFLGRGVGRLVVGEDVTSQSGPFTNGTTAEASMMVVDRHPPATKAIQKLLDVLYAVWLLWILYSIGTAATTVQPQ